MSNVTIFYPGYPLRDRDQIPYRHPVFCKMTLSVRFEREIRRGPDDDFIVFSSDYFLGEPDDVENLVIESYPNVFKILKENFENVLTSPHIQTQYRFSRTTHLSLCLALRNTKREIEEDIPEVNSSGTLEELENFMKEHVCSVFQEFKKTRKKGNLHV